MRCMGALIRINDSPLNEPMIGPVKLRSGSHAERR